MGKKRGKNQPGITTGKPIPGTPTVRQIHHLRADDFVTGAPRLGESTCSEGPPKPPPPDLVTGSPILRTPEVRQVHHLTVAANSPGAQQTSGARKLNAEKAAASRELIENHARAYWAKIPEAAEKKLKTARQVAPAVRASLPDDDRHKRQPDDELIDWVRKNLPKK
jgi:hypothetical protein